MKMVATMGLGGKCESNDDCAKNKKRKKKQKGKEMTERDKEGSGKQQRQ